MNDLIKTLNRRLQGRKEIAVALLDWGASLPGGRGSMRDVLKDLVGRGARRKGVSEEDFLDHLFEASTVAVFMLRLGA